MTVKLQLTVPFYLETFFICQSAFKTIQNVSFE